MVFTNAYNIFANIVRLNEWVIFFFFEMKYSLHSAIENVQPKYSSSFYWLRIIQILKFSIHIISYSCSQYSYMRIENNQSDKVKIRVIIITSIINFFFISLTWENILNLFVWACVCDSAFIGRYFFTWFQTIMFSNRIPFSYPWNVYSI